MSDVVIFGTGSFAEVVDFYLTHDSGHRVVAFSVNLSQLRQREFLGRPVVAFEEVERRYPPDAVRMCVAVGYRNVNKIRASIYGEAKKKGYELVTYVSSRCTRWENGGIGDNCFIFEDNTLQPFVTIGNNVVMWSGNHIGHHSVIGDHCFISSHVVISGHVKVGRYCFLGVNSTIRENVTIGEECVIGAGALVLSSTQDKEVYAPRRTRPRTVTSDRIAF